ncbi:MAG: glucosylglycerol hydrolase, partial [Halapricum sp.]
MTTDIRLLEGPTEDLREWHRERREDHDDDFEAAKDIVTRLGAHYEDELAEIGFWTPEIIDAGVPSGDVYLEVLTPTEDVRVFEDGVDQQAIEMRRDLLSIHREGEYHWAVVEGMRPGTREQF